MFGRNPSFGSRDGVQASVFFLSNLTFSAGVTLKMRSRSRKSNHFFPMSQSCFCASLVKIHYCFRRYSADKAHFYSLLLWCPWKLGQGHQNLINSLIIPMIKYIKFGQNPLSGSRDRVQTSFFLSQYDIQSTVVTLKMRSSHQNLIISSPCLSGVSVQVWSKSTYWLRR